MAKCQVPECYNRRDKDKGKKSFFRIPDPAKGYRDFAQRWLSNIGSGRKVEGFVFSKNKLVCEDHFEVSCFRQDLQAQVLGYRPTRKKLKLGSIPTVFKSCLDGRRDPKTLWPSQHMAVSSRTKNVRRARNVSRINVAHDVPSTVNVPSCPSTVVSSPPMHGLPSTRDQLGIQEAPLALIYRPAASLPTVTMASSHNATPRETSTRPTLAPAVNAIINQQDKLHVSAPGNYFKVRLVEFADKESQTDPVMILPIKRFDCWQGNKV